MHQGTPEALLATIARSGHEATQGWLSLMSRALAPAAAAATAGAAQDVPAWLSELQRNAQRFGALQAAYVEKQAQLWSALLGGNHQALVQAEPGDRRFAAKAWDENPYYDYLKQSYLLAS